MLHQLLHVSLRLYLKGSLLLLLLLLGDIGWRKPSFLAVARSPPPSASLIGFGSNQGSCRKAELRLTNITLKRVLGKVLNGRHPSSHCRSNTVAARLDLFLPNPKQLYDIGFYRFYLLAVASCVGKVVSHCLDSYGTQGKRWGLLPFLVSKQRLTKDLGSRGWSNDEVLGCTYAKNLLYETGWLV